MGRVGLGGETMKRSAWMVVVALLLFFPGTLSAAGDESHGGGASLPIGSVIPFALMLISIAVLPLTVPHWWESNRN